MATSAIAINKARVLAEKGEAEPENSIIDAEGNPTTDASTMFGEDPGALLPFGLHKGRRADRGGASNHGREGQRGLSPRRPRLAQYAA
ncbi:Ldh family oxidoreductase [Cupriavidus sp. LEh21]|nr:MULTISPECIES: Ldh family oxidoreductase [unclassified Cupriavidus]MDK2660534.1 Ldh family oxidoreductase [Cupriavidus sp. LEh21]